MRKLSMISAFALALMVPVAASAQEGTATGAVGGAIVGGVVGGPVGAAVGAGVGATVGAAGDAQNRPNTVVVQPESTGTVRERSTTCVEGAASTNCTTTDVRR